MKILDWTRSLPWKAIAPLAGAILIAPAAWTQAVAPAEEPAEEQRPNRTNPDTRTGSPPPADEMADEMVVLSPFNVDASNDIGYYAENTLVGSRLNTNVGDLAASITVVTRQQLEDTASVDINDVFLYEANTEGVNNYTAYEINRGHLKDLGAGHSSDAGATTSAATTNRIRGLSAADTSQNNYPTINRMPFDVYNTQSIEISRGPNSLLFGLGSAAGIVNQSTANAVLNVRSTNIEARVGSWGSRRASISHNMPLIDDKLAVYGAAMYEEKGFRRKPSYDKTRRYYGSITYKPFPNTIIRGMVEDYWSENRRPNYITPREFVSNWYEAGRPVYDGTTRMVTLLDGGQTFGPYVTGIQSPGYVEGDTTGDNALNNANSNLRVPAIQFIGSAQDIMLISPDGDAGFVQRHQTAGAPGAATRTPEQWLIADRRLTQSRGPDAPINPITGLPVMTPWYSPTLTDKSLYDFETVNILAPNFAMLTGNTYNVELEQKIADNLFLQVGWFRQEVDTKEQRPISNTGPATILIDTNTHLIDGTPNPYFLAPYIDDYQADTFTNPEENDNLRAQLAYQLDFSRNDNFTRWLGRHRMLGFWSRQDVTTRRTRARIAYVQSPVPEGASATWNYAQNSGGVRRYYYMGGNGVVNAANPGLGNPGPLGTNGRSDYTLHAYNWETGAYEDRNIILNTEYFFAGTGQNNRVIDSRNLALQSHLLGDRIITTFGWRTDDYEARSASGGVDVAGLVDGRLEDINRIFNNWGPKEKLSGTTTTRGIVVRPFRGFKYIGGLSFHYNESDNFNPPGSNQTDFYGNPLPKPTGEGKDWGVGISLFDNKLTARVNWFENSNRNERGRVATTFVGRTHRIDRDAFRSWAEMVVRIRSGEDPEDPLFADVTNDPSREFTDAQRAQVEAITGLPYDFPDGGPSISATSSNSAEGLEIQLIYNPVRNWTMKFTAGKQETVYDDVAPEWDPWHEERMDRWTSATAPDMPATFQYRGGEREVSLRNFWSAYGYRGNEIEPNVASGWFNTEAYHRGLLLNEVEAIRSQEGLVSPGQRKWRANFITNYAIQEGRFRGVSFGGAARWEDKSSIGSRGFIDEDGVMRRGDPNQPIFGDEEFHVDMWISYATRIMDDKVRVKVQLNVRDALESGGLQAIAANMDGTPYAYRIVDPRQFYITTRFEF